MSEQKMIRCIVSGASLGTFEHVPAIEVNGRKVAFSLNTEITLPDWAVTVLENSAGYDVEILNSPPAHDGDGDGVVAGPGGASDGVDTFDAEALIQGPVPVVEAKLEGLTAEELDQVAAAEADREAPRSTLLAAIEKAKEALAGGE